MSDPDTTTCTITPESFLQAAITCTTKAAEDWTVWATTIAACVSALLTVAAVVIAWRAWLGNLHNLRLITRQIAEQKVAAKKAIEAQEKLALESRQMAYLADYCASLLKLSHAMGRKDEEIGPAAQECTRRWMIWSMQLITLEPAFRSLTSRWNKRFVSGARSVHGRIQHAPAGSKIHEKIATEGVQLAGHIATFISNIQVWQTDPSRRVEILGNLLVIDKLAPEEKSAESVSLGFYLPEASTVGPRP